MGVYRTAPEMRRMQSLRTASSLGVWELCDQTGAQYSAQEKQRAMEEVRRVEKFEPHLWVASFCRRLKRLLVLVRMC